MKSSQKMSVRILIDYMKNFNKISVSLYVLLFSLNAQAYECSLDKENKDDAYQSFLNSSQSILADLKNENNKCAPEAQEVDRFANSINSYKESMGLNNWTIYSDLNSNDVDYKITCHNYQQVFSAQHDLYVKNRSLNRDTDGQEVFASRCDAEADYQTCASIEYQEKIEEKKVQCQSIVSEDQWRARKNSQVNFLNQMNNFMKDSLNKLKDPVCQKSHSKEYIGNMFKNLLMFTGEVLTIGAGPTGGLAYAGATGLMDSVISFLGDNTDFMDMIQNEESTRSQACFFKNLQRRVFGCSNYQQVKQREQSLNDFNSAVSCARETKPIFDNAQDFSKLLGYISKIEDKDGEDLYFSLLNSFDKNNLGASTLKGIQSLQSLPKDSEVLNSFFKVNSGPRGDRIKARKELELFQNKLKDLKPILKALQPENAGESPDKLVKELKEYDKKYGSQFFDDLRLIHQLKAKAEGKSYSSLEAYEASQSMIDQFQRMSSSIESGNYRSMELVFNSFMKYFPANVITQTENLSKSMTNIKDSVASSSKDRIEKFQRVIEPLLEFCHQLPEVAYLNYSAKEGVFSSHNLSEHPNTSFLASCAPFYCADGSGLKVYQSGFSEYYLKSSNSKLKIADPAYQKSECSSDDSQCRIEQFKKYSCNKDEALSPVKKRFKEEYLKKGTLCGQAIKN